jgi:hypothetical protein
MRSQHIQGSGRFDAGNLKGSRSLRSAVQPNGQIPSKLPALEIGLFEALPDMVTDSLRNSVKQAPIVVLV